MKMRFVWVGKTRDHRIKDLEGDYLSRVQHYFDCDVALARPSQSGSDAERLTREGEEIRAKLRPSTYTIALDPAGTELDSSDFARMLGTLVDRSAREITFIVGGPLGIDRALLQSVDRRLSLSRMTFPHELCRVLLLEQVYRACSMRSGAPYHK